MRQGPWVETANCVSHAAYSRLSLEYRRSVGCSSPLAVQLGPGFIARPMLLPQQGSAASTGRSLQDGCSTQRYRKHFCGVSARRCCVRSAIRAADLWVTGLCSGVARAHSRRGTFVITRRVCRVVYLTAAVQERGMYPDADCLTPCRSAVSSHHAIALAHGLCIVQLSCQQHLGMWQTVLCMLSAAASLRSGSHVASADAGYHLQQITSPSYGAASLRGPALLLSTEDPSEMSPAAQPLPQVPAEWPPILSLPLAVCAPMTAYPGNPILPTTSSTHTSQQTS